MRLLFWAGLCLAIIIGALAAASDPQVRAAAAADSAVVVEFRGPIQRTGAARWLVADQEIALDAATVLVESEGPAAPGAWAHVQARWQDGGRLTAQRIVTAQTMSLPGASPALLGVITDLAADHGVIASTRVAITADTLILGAPSVGGTAFVRPRYEDSGQITAVVIVATTPDLPDITLLQGTLVAFDDQTWELALESRRARVQIDASTVVEGQPAPGAAVEVVAWLGAEDELRAALATVMAQPPQPQFFKGRLILQVTTTDPQQWSVLVAGAPPAQPWQVQNLLVDLDTALVDERNGSLRPGAWIEGTALAPAEAGLPWTVRTARAQSGSAAEQGGVVLATHTDTDSGLLLWQSDSRAIVVDSRTAIDGVPRVGRYAVVRGKMLGESTLWAGEARMRYVFRGWLISRGSDQSPPCWLIAVPRNAEAANEVVGRVAVRLDSSSLVDPALDSGALDVFVEVQARATRDGWLVETVRLADFSVH